MRDLGAEVSGSTRWFGRAKSSQAMTRRENMGSSLSPFARALRLVPEPKPTKDLRSSGFIIGSAGALLGLASSA